MTTTCVFAKEPDTLAAEVHDHAACRWAIHLRRLQTTPIPAEVVIATRRILALVLGGEEVGPDCAECGHPLTYITDGWRHDGHRFGACRDNGTGEPRLPDADDLLAGTDTEADVLRALAALILNAAGMWAPELPYMWLDAQQAAVSTESGPAALAAMEAKGWNL